ncbi:hypothetical protein AMECASPLE_018793 [Ameca splendens]|uniref:Uncharacterized protein n=1 Tax=Ameca splendens TaxID=208324 RepID=A0ABV1A009_9TELE
MSSRYLLTSHTDPGAFPTSEVTFHSLRAFLEVSCFDRCLILFVPVSNGSPCRWSAHLALCLSFGLGPDNSVRSNPGTRRLLTSPYTRPGSRVVPSSTVLGNVTWLVLVLKKVSEPHFV